MGYRRLGVASLHKGCQTVYAPLNQLKRAHHDRLRRLSEPPTTGVGRLRRLSEPPTTVVGRLRRLSEPPTTVVGRLRRLSPRGQAGPQPPPSPAVFFAHTTPSPPRPPRRPPRRRPRP